MCESCKSESKAYLELDGALEQGVASDLIEVLQQAQGVYGYLSREVMQHIAVSLQISYAKVLGVATFYAQFRLEKSGKYVVMLCEGTACHVNGAADILDILESVLGIKCGETTACGLFTLQGVACLGCCSLAPAMMIGDKVYGNLTPDSVKRIIAEFKKGEERP